MLLDEFFGGLSGVNFALFGFMFLFHFIKPNGPLYVSKQLSIGIFAFLAISATELLGKFSFYSHLSGLIIGMLVGYFAVRKFRGTQV